MNALVWLTHVWTPDIEAEFEKLLRLNGPDVPEVWLLLDARTPGAAELVRRYPRCHVFEPAALLGLPYPKMEGRPFVDHCHFPVFDFFLAHGDYERYWVVEYDVRYTGDWAQLLETYERFDHDLLTSHIRRHAQEPLYYWWDSLQHPAKLIPRERLLRSLNVIHRISRPALRFLHQAQLEGWQGFFEVLYPTLLHEGGFKLLDFGGNGEFVPPQHKNRLYTSHGNRNGSLHLFGTLRFRPARVRAGRKPNTLYHPVKPKSMREPFGMRLRLVARWIDEGLRDLVSRVQFR
jgi:hypothetical protein